MTSSTVTERIAPQIWLPWTNPTTHTERLTENPCRMMSVSSKKPLDFERLPLLPCHSDFTTIPTVQSQHLTKTLEASYYLFARDQGSTWLNIQTNTITVHIESFLKLLTKGWNNFVFQMWINIWQNTNYQHFPRPTSQLFSTFHRPRFWIVIVRLVSLQAKLFVQTLIHRWHHCSHFSLGNKQKLKRRTTDCTHSLKLKVPAWK